MNEETESSFDFVCENLEIDILLIIENPEKKLPDALKECKRESIILTNLNKESTVHTECNIKYFSMTEDLNMDNVYAYICELYKEN